MLLLPYRPDVFVPAYLSRRVQQPHTSRTSLTVALAISSESPVLATPLQAAPKGDSAVARSS